MTTVSFVLVLIIWTLIVLPTLLVVCFWLLYKIWTADPMDIVEYQRLKDLVRRANDGQADAEHQCENEPRIRVDLSWDKRWGTRKRYVVPFSVVARCFGYN